MGKKGGKNKDDDDVKKHDEEIDDKKEEDKNEKEKKKEKEQDSISEKKKRKKSKKKKRKKHDSDSDSSSPRKRGKVTIPSAMVCTMSDTPCRVMCTFCNEETVTFINYKVGSGVWVAFLVMFFFGLWICSLIPFCATMCKDAEHRCSNCGQILGVNKKM